MACRLDPRVPGPLGVALADLLAWFGQALRDFEVQMGLVTPETGKVAEATKELGPAAKTKVAAK